MLTKEQIIERLKSPAYAQTKALKEVGETALALYEKIEDLEGRPCAPIAATQDGGIPALSVEPKRTGTGTSLLT